MKIEKKCIVYIRDKKPEYNFKVAMAFKWLGFPYEYKKDENNEGFYEVTNHRNTEFFKKIVSEELLNLNKYGLKVELNFYE